MFKRTFLCIFMSFIVLFMSISNSFVVYADYEEDDKIFDFMSEFIKQRNVVNQAKIIYDEYIKNGISASDAFDFAINQVGSLVTDTAALTNSIKNTWNALTGTQKSNLVDFYNEYGSSDVVINIPIDAQINLNVPSFDPSYKGTNSSYNSSGIQIVDVATFHESILPPYTDPSLTKVVSVAYSGWSKGYCYLYSTIVIKSGSCTVQKGYVKSPYLGTVAVKQYSANNSYLSFKWSVYYQPMYYYVDHVGSDLASVVPSITYNSTATSWDGWNLPLTSYFMSSSYTTAAFYDGVYYVVPLASNILNVNYQNIINDYHTENNYNDYSVNYYPYTVNVNSNSDMPSDVNWLDELKKIFNGETVNYINITINNNNYYGDDDPDPDDPADPDDPVDPVVPDGWFDGILNSISGIFSFLNPSSDDFFLKVAFVPSDDFMQSEILKVRDSTGEKIPLMGQIFDIISKITVLLNSEFIDDSPPSFNITLPAYYGGGTYSIIDFSYFNSYRSLIHGVISVTCFYYFVRRLLKKLPAIILH